MTKCVECGFLNAQTDICSACNAVLSGGSVDLRDRAKQIYYENVLRRYIRHVGEAEGTNFIDCLNNHTRSDVKFTPEEVAELQRLEKEALDL